MRTGLRLTDPVRAEGTLRCWARPDRMPVEVFKSLPLHMRGRPTHSAHNVMTNQWWLDIFSNLGYPPGGGATPLQILYLALGTGLTPVPTRFSPQMIQEWNRYSPTGIAISNADPPSITLSFFSPAADGAVSITEAGLFYGQATTGPGTGTMASYLVFAYPKSTNQDVLFAYTISRSLLT